MPRSGSAELYGSSIFNFLRNFHTVFRSSYTNLQFHQQCSRISFLHHPQWHLFFVTFSITAIYDKCEVIPCCGLVCISPMVRDVEHIFPWLLAICISSLEKHLFCSAHFKIVCFFFFNYWIVGTIYMCWILIPFGHIICKYFPLSNMGFSFCQWFPLLCKSCLSYLFIFAFIYFRNQIQKYIAALCIKECSAYVFL